MKTKNQGPLPPLAFMVSFAAACGKFEGGGNPQTMPPKRAENQKQSKAWKTNCARSLKVAFDNFSRHSRGRIKLIDVVIGVVPKFSLVARAHICTLRDEYVLHTWATIFFHARQTKWSCGKSFAKRQRGGKESKKLPA